MEKTKNIILIGAGLVGSLLACYLSRRGHQVYVFERRADFRKTRYEGGRSINLALSERGMRALRHIGMMDRVQQLAIPMPGRLIHRGEEKPFFQPYGQQGESIFSVSRGQLNQLLVAEAEKTPQVSFHFGQRCVAVDLQHNLVTFSDNASGEEYSVHGDVILGTDGAFSELRYAMQRQPGFNIHQVNEPYGYKELSIPAGAGGQHQIEANALHIWPRDSFMMIALPNLDGSFTNTLFAPFSGPYGFDALKTKDDVQAYFRQHFPTAYPLMTGLEEEFFANPTSSLTTIRCYPWAKGKACLLGDSAHAIVPFYGQGMNCGFEDVFELNRLLDEYGDDWEGCLQAFQQIRKPNADAILDLALYNYVEMRDLAGKDWFQLRLKLEKRIAQAFPDRFMTLYSMVTFSNIPYAEAQARAQRQAVLLDELMQWDGIAERWESEDLLKRAAEWLANNA